MDSSCYLGGVEGDGESLNCHILSQTKRRHLNSFNKSRFELRNIAEVGIVTYNRKISAFD